MFGYFFSEFQQVLGYFYVDFKVLYWQQDMVIYVCFMLSYLFGKFGYVVLFVNILRYIGYFQVVSTCKHIHAE